METSSYADVTAAASNLSPRKAAIPLRPALTGEVSQGKLAELFLQ